jgi:hypothetical protein
VSPSQARPSLAPRARSSRTWRIDPTFPYITNNGFSGRKYFPQTLCGGVAVLDFDNDGWMDLFFTNGASFPSLQRNDAAFYNTLLPNRWDGTFEDITQHAGLVGERLGFSLGAAVGDYDNDGFPDLFMANAGANALYHNNGNGTFTDVTAASGLNTKPLGTLSVQGAKLDYGGDGPLDLVVSNYTIWTPKRLAVARLHMSGPEESLKVLDEAPTEHAGDFLLMRARLLDVAGRRDEAGRLLTQGLRVPAVQPEIAAEARLFSCAIRGSAMHSTSSSAL